MYKTFTSDLVVLCAFEFAVHVDPVISCNGMNKVFCICAAAP